MKLALFCDEEQSLFEIVFDQQGERDSREKFCVSMGHYAHPSELSDSDAVHCLWAILHHFANCRWLMDMQRLYLVWSRLNWLLSHRG